MGGTMNCGQCGKHRGTDSPSADFCSEDCQYIWWQKWSGCTDPETAARIRQHDEQIVAILRRWHLMSLPR